MSETRVVIIGAGIAGLAAAVDLAARGLDVTVVEAADAPGGKMRELPVDGRRVDSGPTVLTMPWVFEELFDDAGARLADYATLEPAELLARHAWDADARLDLYVDEARSAEAIAALAGPGDARGYRAFCRHARDVFETLYEPFMRASRPTPGSLVANAGAGRLPGLLRMKPFADLWSLVARHFDDPRLRQLFGRYATYCGSSPYRATATLALIAHVEGLGVRIVAGGMSRLAEALAALARDCGASVRYGAPAAAIEVERGRARGVRLADGERLAADAVIANADVATIAAGHLGEAAARAADPVPRERRSLSAMTWSLHARAEGFDLAHHNVFFGRDYAAEFTDIFGRGRTPADPTVYVCAEDRDDRGRGPTGERERLFCIVNAPPTGDRDPFGADTVARTEAAAFGVLERCGLRIDAGEAERVVTTPADFERRFPGTGGALYGATAHGWRASFERPGARSRIPGLYLAGGSVHPGPGVPMVAISGRLAAASLVADLGGRTR